MEKQSLHDGVWAARLIVFALALALLPRMASATEIFYQDKSGKVQSCSDAKKMENFDGMAWYLGGTTMWRATCASSPPFTWKKSCI